MKKRLLNTSHASRGYIAITSAIIITMLVMMIVFAINLIGYFSRYNVLTSELKDISLSLAEGCAEKALLKYAEDSAYAGNENITVGARQCNILPVETSGSDRILKTKAVVESTTSNIKVVFNGNDMAIVSWEELPNL